MQIVGLVISWAVAIGIIGIGIGYAAKSEMNARGGPDPIFRNARYATLARPSLTNGHSVASDNACYRR
jgi:hypothetical protein